MTAAYPGLETRRHWKEGQGPKAAVGDGRSSGFKKGLVERGSQVGFVTPALPLQGLFLRIPPWLSEGGNSGFPFLHLWEGQSNLLRGHPLPSRGGADAEDGCKSVRKGLLLPAKGAQLRGG